MTINQSEPEPETFDDAIIVTHLDGTEERFPVKIIRRPAAPKEDK